MAKNPYLEMVEQGQSVNAVSGGNPYLDMVESGIQRDNSAFKASATLAIEVNPDEVARQRRIAELLKVPPSAVAALPDESAQQARLLEIDTATKDAPALRRRFTREDFARLAHDDVETLAGIERTITGTLRDIAVTGVKGAVGLPQAALGLVSIVDGGRLARLAERGGLRVNETQQILGEWFSPAQQEANRKVDQADGFLDTLATAVQNPSTIAVALGESAPLMGAGGLVGRGVLLAAPRVGALGAAAAGEGIVGAGAAAEQMRSNNEDGLLTGKERAAAVGLGAGTALLSAVGGKLSQKLGVGDIDTAIAAGKLTRQEVRKSLVRELAEGGISEGLFEEMPQSMQEQVWQNWAEDKPLLEGVGDAGAMGLLSGGVMGAGFQGAQRLAMRDAKLAESAEAQAKGIEQLNKLAAASKTIQRDAATVQEFVKEAEAEGADSLYIGGRELMQSGVADAVAQVSPAVAEQIEQAAATGGMVRIPLSEYTARIAGTEYAQPLLDYLKVNPEGFSRAEAREYLQTQGEQLKAEVEQTLAKAGVDDAFRQSQDALRQAVLANLNEVGRFTPQTNEAYAELITARTSARAARLGMTPEALFAKDLQTLRVRGEGQAPGRVLNQEAGNLPQVVAGIESAGLTINASERDGVITLSRIVVPEAGRNQGAGTAAMQQLIAYADATGQRVALSPSADFGGNKKRLTEFYGRFGFKANKGRSRDLAISEAMIREPQQREFNQTDGVESDGAAGVDYANGQQALESRLLQWANDFNLNGRGRIGIVAGEWAEPARYKAEPGRKNPFLSADDVVATPEEGRAEQERLVAAAKENGFFFGLDHPLFKALTLHEKRGGMEHDAYIVGDDNERVVIRNTLNGGFGHGSKHSPAEYLKRLRDYNQLFPHLQTRMIGVVQEPDGTVSILTAQVFAPGKEYPSNKELDAALRKLGWFAMGVPSEKLPARYKHNGTGAILADVHHGNILHDGEKLYPIDVIVEKLPAEGRVYNQTVYHGTPYKFDKFSLEHLGKGEGAQVYGWGLYFASVRDIAEHYRQVLTRADGKGPVRQDYTSMIPRQIDASVKDVVARLDRDILVAESNLQSTQDNPDAFESGYAEDLQRTLDNLRARRERANLNGQLYEVNIPDGGFLLWDKPLSEQPEVDALLRNAPEAQSANGRYLLENATGKQVYEHLVTWFDGSQEAASKFLNGLGVPGIQYLDGDSRRRPLREVKAEFLAELPDDAETDEVVALIGTGRFSPANEAVLKALAADSWLGFDYPSQALSAALGGQLQNFDPSPALLQAVSDAQEGGTFNYVLFDDAAAEIVKTYYQDKADPRGSFNADATVMTLLKGADLSTFLHEGGHYFFEADIALVSDLLAQGRELTPGERSVVEDVSTLLKWHGIQGTIEDQLRQWHTMSFSEQEAAHERTAESFEAYLFEGKAPSIELTPYFTKFRSFLTRVYSSLKAFLQRYPEAGKLDDTVRAVFDRMLATDEQIALAQQARSMQAMFRTEADAQAVGMTPEEFAAYQAQDAERVGDAVQDLQGRALRDLQWTRNARAKAIKKLQRQSAETRREVRMDVRREVMSQPVYRAWQFLTAKITADDKITPETLPKSDKERVTPEVDSLFVAIAKLGGIARDDAADTWGITDKINPPVFGKPVLRATGGRSIDAMAEALGELGYLTRDRDGRVDVRELEERFGDELRGTKRFSNQVDGRVLMEQMPGANVNIGGLTAGRLDENALLEMGLDDLTLATLRKQRMVAKDGLHPDLVAPYFDFGTGVDMVDALASVTPPAIEIEGLTDARMLAEFGELATPEAIERQADIAIHNEARARMVMTEANALARATGQRKVLFEAAKQYASEMIARLRVRDVRPAHYTAAAARAGKLADQAMRKSDLPVAGAEKRNQVLNTLAAKQATDALAEVEKGLRYLKKFASDGVRQKLDVEYLDQIDSLLERFDLRAGQSLKAIDKRASLAEWVAGMEQEGLEPDLPAYILAEANRQHYRNLTVEQFRELVESVQQIEHLGRLKKRLLTAKDQRELDAIVESIKERIEESSGGRIVDNEVRNTAGDWMRDVARSLLSSHRKAASVARELDGFQDGGPVWEYLIRGMNEAGDREATLRADASKRLQALAEPILKGEKMGGQGQMFPSLGRRLNRGERLAIALNWGNESNRQRLMDGRGWSEAQLAPVLSSLSAEEWAFVQGVWDFFESYRPEIGAKERRVYGKEPKWIDPAPFTVRTADGQDVQVRGGYYPIKYDPRQSGKAAQFAEAEEAKAMMRAAYTAATTRRSFTKGRAEKVVGRPVLLTFDGIWQGANEVIHDLTWHEWLIDANRLMGRLDSTIRQAYGAEKVDVLRKAIKDTARGDLPATDWVDRALTHVRNGTSIVGMGWNLTTALLQPLGLTNSIVRVGAPWMAKGLARFYGSPLHMAEVAREVQEMSPMMASRAATMNREIADVRNQLVEGKSKARTAVEASFFVLIQKLQAGVDYPTWLGAYEKAIADPANLNPDGTINEARAIALADQAVIDAQGGGTIKDLAGVQRGAPLRKLFTNFYSYFNVLFNLTYERTAATDFRRPKEVAALMGDYLLLMVVPAVASAVLRNALKGEDDEDEYAKDIAAELVGYPLGMFVLGRELAGGAQMIAGVGEPAFGYTGPAGTRFFAETYKLSQQINQGEVDMALFKAANNSAGILFHYPAGQVNRLVDGTAALLEGRTDNPLAPLVGPPPR